MSAQLVIQFILQFLTLLPSLRPIVVQAINDFDGLFKDGAEPTQEQTDAIIARAVSQSDEIQALK